MYGCGRIYRDQMRPSSSSWKFDNGVCMMNDAWKAEQSPRFIDFVSTFLTSNSYRLNSLPIAPDFIFNNGGLSVAFIFITNWDSQHIPTIFARVNKLKIQFRYFYVVATIASIRQIESFIDSYFKYAMEIGKPTFIIVDNPESGFEKIVKLAHARGEYKRKDAISKLKAEVMENYVNVITSIPGLDKHDANSVLGSIGSIEALSKASKEQIMENTDLSAEKAQTIERFFRDPEFYLCPKIN